MARTRPRDHEPIEIRRELRIAVERQNVRDELVRPHDHHAAPRAIDAAQGEDVLTAFVVGAEDLLVVAQSVAPFGGSRKDGMDSMSIS